MVSRTSLSGYLQSFFTSVVLLSIICMLSSASFRFDNTDKEKSLDYLTTYYQACKVASPIAAGVDMFGTAFTIVPAGIISGVTVAKTTQYRPQLWLSWMLVMIGTGLMSTLDVDSTRGSGIGYQAITGIGIGILVTCLYFPVLAPLPLSENANAIAFFMFCRNFAQVCGCKKNSCNCRC